MIEPLPIVVLKSALVEAIIDEYVVMVPVPNDFHSPIFFALNGMGDVSLPRKLSVKVPAVAEQNNV